jgi:hypothetical protein
LTPTWMISDTVHRAEYWVLRRRVPEWVFYLLVALWPTLRRSVVGLRRHKMFWNHDEYRKS